MAKLMNVTQNLKLGMDGMSACANPARTTLSKNSRVFKGPAKDLSQQQMNESRQISQFNRKNCNKKPNESDFSTDESDTDANSPVLNLSSAAFYLKSSQSASHNMKTSDETRGEEKSLNKEFGDRSDRRPKTRSILGVSPNDKVKSGKDTKGEGRQEATIIKPKKKFNNRQEKTNFVESFKAKKKTELCRNFETIGK